MQASLAQEAGVGYKVAALLLAPLFASLSEAEFDEVCHLIRETSQNRLRDTRNSFERPGAVGVTAAMMTRHSNNPGMSEVSDILTLAGQYMDINQVMPPEGSKWTPNLIESLLPDSINSAIDGVGDFLTGLVIPVSKEYKTADPVDLVTNSSQTPGYISGLFSTLESNIKGVEFSTSSDTTASDGISVGWGTAIAALIGAGAFGALSSEAIQSLISGLSADGETPNTIDRSSIVNMAKELGIDEIAMMAAL